MNSYVVINDSADGTSYPVDTPEEIEAAEIALVNAGQYSARIYFGDPADPDSYWSGQTLYQLGWAHERNGGAKGREVGPWVRIERKEGAAS